jgi:dihydrolipoamide dehydrogenase
LEQAGVNLDDRGLIRVDAQMRTTRPKIFAIGDVVPGPALAHKAAREGKVAAEVIAGKPAAFDNVAIPAVIYTDPEIAYAGLTEDQAKAQGREVRVGRFPLSALGRAKTIGRTDGLAKVVTDPGSGKILGVGLAGPHASELIAAGVLALEMGATVEDLAVTIHPHPTLSEAVMEAAEAAEGLPVHLMPARKR